MDVSHPNTANKHKVHMHSHTEVEKKVNVSSCTALHLPVWMQGRHHASWDLVRVTVSNEKWQLPSPGEPSSLARLQILFAPPAAPPLSVSLLSSYSHISNERSPLSRKCVANKFLLYFK